MKSKRIMLVLAMLAVLIAGWYFSVKAASGVEVKEKQEELVQKADVLASKELYIRAIPLYEEALRYNTNANVEIEEKLLDAYLDFGQEDLYVSLIEKRIARERASEEEYQAAAQYYLDSSTLEKGMEVLKKGMGRFETGVLEEMYEENRYGCSIRFTSYQEILPTFDNNYMPAFDGEKWGYVNDKGKMVLPFQYDSATRFNRGGYAVVSYEGKYYVITKSGARYGVDETGLTDVYGVTASYVLGQKDGYYSYYNYDFECVAPSHQYEEMTENACGLAAVKKDGKWGIITDSGSGVVDFVLEDVAVNSLGDVYANDVAMVKKDGLWCLIDREGKELSEMRYADAKAPESNGYIAVANEEGLWGFINQKGEVVIDYQYVDAKSFSQHLAAVKVGGSWGYISEKNVLVIEQFIEAAEPFHNGIAQVKFADGEGLIMLDYVGE